jgi:hydroxymethylglutaryl-CoA lyase
MVDVTVVEVAPRDGLQNESTPVSTEDKVTLIRRSISAGLRRIEATSFVHPRRVPQMADAEAVMAAVPRTEGVSYIGLVLNRRGLDRALAAGVDEINAVVVTTESFAERNQGMSVDATVDMAAEVVSLARAAGGATSVTVSTAFGCPYEGEVPLDKVLTLVERVTAAEPDEIAFGDTIGVGVPAQVREIVRGARDVAPGVRLRMHFHNTRNTGYANALAAVDAGVTVLDASTGGVGGCPFAPGATGNIATEDLLYALHRSGHRTGVDLPEVAGTGVWLGSVLGARVPAQLGRAGSFPPPP